MQTIQLKAEYLIFVVDETSDHFTKKCLLSQTHKKN